MKTTFIFSLVLAILFSCKKKEVDPVQTINDQKVIASDTLGKGSFVSYEHGLQGKAILFQQAGGNKILRLENFNMTAGPDVYVFLSTSNTYSPGKVLEVSKLTTGYQNSNLNFTITDMNYNSNYIYVLVYCKQYTSIFGYTKF